MRVIKIWIIGIFLVGESQALEPWDGITDHAQALPSEWAPLQASPPRTRPLGWSITKSLKPRPRPDHLLKEPKVPDVVMETTDLESTGFEIFDRSFRGEESSTLLPFWINYPWAELKTPLLWTQYMAEGLRQEQSLVRSEPKDVELFCPNYRNLNEDQRIAFWLRLISLLMEQESTYRPLRFYHSVNVERGLYSIGMLMLSFPSSQQRRFGCSMIRSQDDLFEWRKNFDCGLKIMAYYLKEDQVIASHTIRTQEESEGRWMGWARYWEPFRDNRLKGDRNRSYLLRFVKQRRKAWSEEGRQALHPALKDDERQPEKPLTRILRMTNQMEFCPSGRADDFESISEIPIMAPRPRPVRGLTISH